MMWRQSHKLLRCQMKNIRDHLTVIKAFTCNYGTFPRMYTTNTNAFLPTTTTSQHRRMFHDKFEHLASSEHEIELVEMKTRALELIEHNRSSDVLPLVLERREIEEKASLMDNNAYLHTCIAIGQALMKAREYEVLDTLGQAVFLVQHDGIFRASSGISPGSHVISTQVHDPRLRTLMYDLSTYFVNISSEYR